MKKGTIYYSLFWLNGRIGFSCCYRLRGNAYENHDTKMMTNKIKNKLCFSRGQMLTVSIQYTHKTLKFVISLALPRRDWNELEIKQHLLNFLVQ